LDRKVLTLEGENEALRRRVEELEMWMGEVKDKGKR